MVSAFLTGCGGTPQADPASSAPLEGGEARFRLSCPPSWAIGPRSDLLANSGVTAFRVTGCDQQALQGLKLFPPGEVTVTPDCANLMVLLSFPDSGVAWTARTVSMAWDGTFQARFQLPVRYRSQRNCVTRFEAALDGKAICLREGGFPPVLKGLSVNVDWSELPGNTASLDCPTTLPCLFHSETELGCR